jgi:thioredoxin reductase (NADPH)
MLKDRLAAIDGRVSIVLFTQTFGGSPSGPVALQVLQEIAPLNERIEIVEKNVILDAEDRERYGVEREPTIVILRNGEDTRMRFLGAPTGYEFVALVEAIMLAGTGESSLRPSSQTLLATVNTPLDIKVFSTPT